MENQENTLFEVEEQQETVTDEQENNEQVEEQEEKEKLFTQEDVNNIVKNRLHKEKEQHTRELQELQSKIQKNQCVNFLIESGITHQGIQDDFLTLITHTDFEDFKDKFHKLSYCYQELSKNKASNEPKPKKDILRNIFTNKV